MFQVLLFWVQISEQSCHLWKLVNCYHNHLHKGDNKFLVNAQWKLFVNNHNNYTYPSNFMELYAFVVHYTNVTYSLPQNVLPPLWMPKYCLLKTSISNLPWNLYRYIQPFITVICSLKKTFYFKLCIYGWIHIYTSEGVYGSQRC